MSDSELKVEKQLLATALLASGDLLVEEGALAGDESLRGNSEDALLPAYMSNTAAPAQPPAVNPWKKTAAVQPAKIVVGDDEDTSKDTMIGGGGQAVEKHVKKKQWVSLDALSPVISQMTFTAPKPVVPDEERKKTRSPNIMALRRTSNQPRTNSNNTTSSSNGEAGKPEESASQPRRPVRRDTRKPAAHIAGELPPRPRSQPPAEVANPPRSPEAPEATVPNNATQPPSPVKQAEPVEAIAASVETSQSQAAFSAPYQRRTARLPASAYMQPSAIGSAPYRPRRTYSYGPRATDPEGIAYREQYARAALRLQIEYYFSVENLCRDVYLRAHMEDSGWIDLSFIAQFNRVKFFSADIDFIAASLVDSAVVEMKRDARSIYVRKLADWPQWRFPADIKSGIIAQFEAAQAHRQAQQQPPLSSNGYSKKQQAEIHPQMAKLDISETSSGSSSAALNPKQHPPQ